MKWKKLGKIFDPKNFDLPKGCSEYAQSPQALVFEDFVRIYFSTRLRDQSKGKFLSHIAYVDMSKDFSNVLDISKNNPIELGELGCFDEHGIFPINILRHENVVLAYTSGWSRRVSVSVDTAIGLAISHDNGVSFKRVGNGPVLASSPREPYLIVDGFVKHYGNQFHMWYIFGTSWKQYLADQAPDRIYKIGHAISNDGVQWTKEDGHQIISDRIGQDECQALPTVTQIDDRYHMFFCYRHCSDFRTNPKRGYRIGHAYSSDLLTWTRNDDELAISGTPGEWDSDMLCYPHVFECNEKIYLLYNGNEFGRNGFGIAELER